MAGLTQKIELLITATNRTGSAFSAVGQGLDDMSANVRAVAQPFADVTTAVAKLDAVLAALAGAGLAYAFSESSKLQSSFTELKKVAGDNEAVLNTAKTAAKDLSNAYGESAADVLASTANYVQAGFSVEEAMGLAKTGMDLVIAGGVDASQSSEILIASLKGFKAPASEAERLIDILNETSNNYATDIEQLGRGMAGVSPIARTMGFSMEETAGIITPVIEVFRSGDEAAVALKTGLLKLIDDAKPVQEALASIGVAQRDANGNLRSGKDILYDVARAFQTLNPDQKLFVTQQLVGIDQSARMVEVFDGLSASTQITATAMQSAGSAAKEVAERMKDPEVAVNRLREGFNNLASAIGDEFQAGGASAINGFTGIINALQGEVEGGAFAPILDALDDFLNGLGEKFSTIAENLPEALEAVDYSGFLDSLGEIRDTIGGIFVDIDFEDPESLGNAIQGIIDTLTSLVDFSAEIADVFVSIGQKIGDLVGWFNALDGKTVATAGQITAFGAAVSAVAVPIGVVANAIAGLGGLLNTLSGSAVSTLVKSLVGSGSLSAAFTTVAPLAAAAFGGTAIGTLINEFVPGVKDGMQALAGMIDRYTGLLGVEKDAQKVREQSIEVEAKIKKITVDRTRAVEDSAQKTKAYFQEMVDSEDEAANGLEYLNEELRKTGALVEEEKKVTVDTKDAKKKFQELSYFVSEGEKKGWHTIKTPQIRDRPADCPGTGTGRDCPKLPQISGRSECCADTS